MRVGVNLSWLVPGVVGGSEEGTTRALRALGTRRASDLEVVLFGLDALRRAHPDLSVAFETHTLPLPGRLKALRVAAEHTWLRAMAVRHRIDLLHDAGGTSAGRIGIPRIVTIHDIQPLELPQNFGAVKVAYLRYAIPRAVASAAAVVVPSAFVKERLVRRLHADAAKISVVPWSTPPPVDPMPIETVRARYGILGSIVLVPGITYPHKDHVVAIRAMHHLVDRCADTTMVLIGGEGPAEAEVLAEIDRLKIGHRVVRTGRVPATAVAALFHHAAAVLVPSRYEGFGIPALEALAAGTPVVVSDAGALPEVVGDAGVVFPVGDDVQLAVDLHRVLTDESHRRALATAGLARAKQFTPERTADGLVAAYRSVIASL